MNHSAVAMEKIDIPDERPKVDIVELNHSGLPLAAELNGGRQELPEQRVIAIGRWSIRAVEGDLGPVEVTPKLSALIRGLTCAYEEADRPRRQRVPQSQYIGEDLLARLTDAGGSRTASGLGFRTLRLKDYDTETPIVHKRVRTMLPSQFALNAMIRFVDEPDRPEADNELAVPGWRQMTLDFMQTAPNPRGDPGDEHGHAARADRDWRERAVCRDEDPEIFFPTSSEGKGKYALEVDAAKAICARCTVVHECLAFATHHLPFGIAGGTTAEERRRATDS